MTSKRIMTSEEEQKDKLYQAMIFCLYWRRSSSPMLGMQFKSFCKEYDLDVEWIEFIIDEASSDIKSYHTKIST